MTIWRCKCGGTHIKYIAIKEESNSSFSGYMWSFYFHELHSLHYNFILEEVQELEEMLGMVNTLDTTYNAQSSYHL